jgi:ABC-2 type transport system permease protein
MRKILEIARREYVETIRTKMFLIGLFIVPGIIVVVVLISSRFIVRQPQQRPPVRIGVTCSSDPLFGTIKGVFDNYDKAHSQSPLELQTVKAGDDLPAAENNGKGQLRQHHLDLYVALEGDLAEDSGQVRLYTYRPKPAQMDAVWTVESLFRSAIEDYRCQAKGLDQEQLRRIRNVAVQQVELGSDSGEERVQNQGDRVARMMVPFAFMYLIFMGIAGLGQHMLSSIIEEKNSRIVEVLLSVVSPFELMAGKILGLAGIGLTVTSIWGLAAYGAAQQQGFEVEIGASLIVYFLIYYILGFVLYCAMLSGVGSICNTIKESQSLMMPAMLLLVIPLIFWMPLAQDPNGVMAKVLSFIPPATPMLMVLRLSSGADIWFVEIVASILLLAVSVVAAIWAAAKIFRTGVLMYGKRPSLREVARWLMTK